MTESQRLDTPHDESGSTMQNHVAVLTSDLFFGMRIRTVLGQLGYIVDLAQDANAFLARLAQKDRRPVLGIIDFNAAVDWDALQPVMLLNIPMLAFGAHTNVEGFRAAKAAGVSRVISNGEFTRSLPALVAKYADVHT